MLSLLLLSIALAASAPSPGSAGPATCLDTALAVQPARPDETHYAFEEPDAAVDARGIAWNGVEGHALRLAGDESACFAGGDVAGPYGEDAVYECTRKHCPGGVCPEPCLEYHTTAALAPEVNAALTVIDDFRASHYGDGISLERASGDVWIRRAHLHDLMDDAVESDWGRHSVVIEDSLFDRVAVGLATRQRPKGASKNSTHETWELRDSLVRVVAWPNTYEQRPGHQGFFKADRKKSRQVRYRVTHNVFFAGPLATKGAVLFPIVSQTDACEGNTLYWSGSAEDFEEALDDGAGYPDKLDNRGRLAALADCYVVVVKPAEQSEADFVAEHWDPLAEAWRASHAAGAP